MKRFSIGIIGVVVLMLLIAFVIGVVHRNWVVHERNYKADMRVRTHRVRDLMMASAMYGDEHGILPRELQDLAGFAFYNTPAGKRFFEEAVGKIQVVAPGLDASSRSGDVNFLMERAPDRKGLVVVGYADGHAEAMPFRRAASVLTERAVKKHNLAK